MEKYLLGFDIGGTKCAVVLGRTTGDDIHIIDRVAFPTEVSRGPEYALAELEEKARLLCAQHGLEVIQISAVGISCGGPLDSKRGVILGPPNLPGWHHVPMKERFQTAFGIPVYLQNDADACALAEWKWGAGRGFRHLIFLTFGTGLGAGLILDGRLYTGASDLAGEVGHVRLAPDGPIGYGKRGSFEGFCSGGGIARLAEQVIRQRWQEGENVAFCRDEDELKSLSAQAVAQAAHGGDPVALGIFNTVARRLGQGLAMLIDILNPQAIVIGSIFARQTDLLWPLAKQVIDEEALSLSAQQCQVLPAMLGEQIGDYACLSVAAAGEGACE